MNHERNGQTEPQTQAQAIALTQAGKEPFTEPTCELVEFNFENILANETSPDIFE